jgi:hypothetical protein
MLKKLQMLFSLTNCVGFDILTTVTTKNIVFFFDVICYPSPPEVHQFLVEHTPSIFLIRE